MKIIGLTGGIAVGKSTVAAMLADLGAEIIDADTLSRDAVAPGTPAIEQIRLRFGSHLLLPDGTLDRQAMRNIVFADQSKLHELENILHPAIRELALSSIQNARKSGKEVAVYMAPLLIEARATDRVDEVWVVTVRPEVQLARLIDRDNCNLEDARRIVSAQMPLAEKVSHGVVIIDNSDSLEATKMQVYEAWRQRVLL